MGKPAKSTAKPSAKSPSKKPVKKTNSQVVKKKNCPEADEPKFYPKNYDDTNINIVSFLNRAQKGRLSSSDMRRMHQLAVIKDAKTLKAIRLDTIFERRVTSLSWHPQINNMIGLASKGGGLVLARVSKDNFDVVDEYPGIGPGGSILALKFHPSIKEALFTASLDGTVCYRNFENKKCIQYLSTNSYDHWFTSFDMSEESGVMLAGDTKGTITLLSKSGSKVKEAKIHKTSSKVNHVEFCPRNSSLFVTASLDKSVKLWDLRKIGNDGDLQPLHTLTHVKPVNSACFSRTDNNYLLSTDQGSELRVFQAPFWDLVNILPHPHRQFQHITPIKATWHPLEDIVVCGRYPHLSFPGTPVGELSTVDFMCPVTGQMLYQLHHPPFKNLLSVNQFNNNGSLLGTASGSKSIIWAPHPKTISEYASKEKCEKRSEKRSKYFDDDDEEEEEKTEQEPKSSSSDILQMPSTSHKVMDSLPVNRRSTTDCKKKARTKK